MTAQSVQNALPASYHPAVYCLYIVLKAAPATGGRKKIVIASAGSIEDARRTLAIFNERWGTSFHAWLGLPHADDMIGRWEQRWRLCTEVPKVARFSIAEDKTERGTAHE